MRASVGLLMLLTTSAWAANEDVKNIRDGVKEAFPLYVDSFYEQAVTQYLLIRNFDFSSYSDFLNTEIARSSTETNTLLAQLVATRASDPLNQGARYEYLLARLRSRVQALNEIDARYSATEDAYREVCGDEGMAYGRYFFNPQLLFPIDDLKINPKTADYNFSVSVTAYGSTGTNQGDPNVGATTSVRDAIIVGGSIAAGTAIGSIFGPAGTIVGAKIGAFVGACVTGLIHAFSHVSEQNERWSLLTEIRQIMTDVVHKKTLAQSVYLSQSCDHQLQKSDMSKMIREKISQSRAFLSAQRVAAATELAGEEAAYAAFSESDKKRLHDLAGTYFVNLQNNFVKNSEQYFNDSVKFDNESRAYAMEEVFPRLKNLKATAMVAARTQIKDELWSKLIEGDARLGAGATLRRELNAFPFNAGGESEGRGVWTSVLRLTQGELKK